MSKRSKRGGVWVVRRVSEVDGDRMYFVHTMTLGVGAWTHERVEARGFLSLNRAREVAAEFRGAKVYRLPSRRSITAVEKALVGVSVELTKAHDDCLETLADTFDAKAVTSWSTETHAWVEAAAMVRELARAMKGAETR